jgi:ATP-dependent RNA helicase DeaD
LKFNELGLSTEILQSIEKVGFEEATPIQTTTIPLALKGQDVIGQAQTGTGKTAAFGLPMLQKIIATKHILQGLIIAPTRELAIQTQEELWRLGKTKKIRVQVVYGGANINRQIHSLKDRPHILVGTPGRLLDHINRRTVKLETITTLVLDEADEMLNMGFLDDIEAIIEKIPAARQTLLFSATMPDAIKRIGLKFMKNPEHVKIKAKEMTANLIDQYYIRAKDYEKFDTMTRLLDVQKPELTIVFGRTKRRVDELARGLEARGYKAEGIHGDLTQQKRLSVLRAFKNSSLDILVATDVAARGLDISGVTHVYNYDIPQDPESYVHRIGRTGRAGNEGLSVTFVTPNEIGYLHTIERLTKKKISPMRPPTDSEAFRGALGAAFEEISTKIEKREDLLEKYGVAAEKLLMQHPAEEVAAYLLSTLAASPKNQAKVIITPERPLPERRRRNNNNHRQGYARNNWHSYEDNRKRNGWNYRNKDRRTKDNQDHKRHRNSFEKRQNFVIRNKGNM